FLRVPTGVHVEDQGSEPHDRLGDVCHVGAVRAPADPDEAVVTPTHTLTSDPLRDPLQLLPATLVRQAVGEEVVVNVEAVVAHPGLVEPDGRVGGVHDAPRADLISVHLGWGSAWWAAPSRPGEPAGPGARQKVAF